jgi:Protein of unknown function (DUF998)
MTMISTAAPGGAAAPAPPTASASDSPGVPWWGVLSALGAPLVLVAGWTVAAALQPRSFNAIADTVSALAATGAAGRWVMTLAFAAAGACEVVTGLALRPAAVPGRLILMAGGVAGVLVAANPEHAGGSLAHACWAGIGFAALVTWPGGAWRRGLSVPWGLRPAVSAVATGIMIGLLVWFLAELVTRDGQVGLAERIMGVAQAGWPLAVVLSCRLSWPGARTVPVGIGSVHAARAQGHAPHLRFRHARCAGPTGPARSDRAGPGGLGRSRPVRLAAAATARPAADPAVRPGLSRIRPASEAARRHRAGRHLPAIMRKAEQVPGEGPVIIDTIGIGELLGPSWLFPPYRWSFGAVCAGPVEAFQFDAAAVRNYCATDPAFGCEFSRRLIPVLATRLQSTRAKLIARSRGTPGAW